MAWIGYIAHQTRFEHLDLVFTTGNFDLGPRAEKLGPVRFSVDRKVDIAALLLGHGHRHSLPGNLTLGLANLGGLAIAGGQTRQLDRHRIEFVDQFFDFLIRNLIDFKAPFLGILQEGRILTQ